MKILVTGSAGFIGTNLVYYLKNNTKHKVIEDFSKPLVDIPRVDVVLHQGSIARTFGVAKAWMFKWNYWNPKKLFEELLKKGCKRFIVASSTAIYGNLKDQSEKDDVNPLNDYAESKYFFEEFAKGFGYEHDVNVSILRYCNVFGPQEWKKREMASMVYQLTCQILKGLSPKIYKMGEQRRDWISVEDVCKANVVAVEHDGVDIFNCGSGNSISFNDLIKCINKYLKTDYSPEYIDNPFEGVYQGYIQCDVRKINKILGFKFGKIEEGIEKYVKYLAGNGGISL
jgi:ADP-L-glycero-D-manno-heptose 6-epimerase